MKWSFLKVKTSIQTVVSSAYSYTRMNDYLLQVHFRVVAKHKDCQLFFLVEFDFVVLWLRRNYTLIYNQAVIKVFLCQLGIFHNFLCYIYIFFFTFYIFYFYTFFSVSHLSWFVLTNKHQPTKHISSQTQDLWKLWDQNNVMLEQVTKEKWK